MFEAPPEPSTREHGTDRPPRIRLGSRRGAIDRTDRHDLVERGFAGAVARALDAFAPIHALTVVASPRPLAEMRRALPARLRRAVVVEVVRDLTGHPIEAIERGLADA
ncbi:host attachment protein [Methylobacterium radiotolerans]|uniref:host attachment protein n=1 Tax=Methylobacterium radiotolerans TaxID=31998 RepID=UPI00097814B5|nr:host attachment protein [Methylobacterium radiotolerans]